MYVEGLVFTSIAGPHGGSAAVREIEGRPFEVGNQVLISSRRKLLSSKATVVNVAEQSGRDTRRAGCRETGRKRTAEV